MQVTISELSPVEKKITVELPWPVVAVKLDEAYRDLQKKVEMKGFRRGKVPRAILEQRYRQRVEQDVVQKLVQETFITAATEHKIEPVAEPVVDDAHLHKGKNFHYSARVEVRSVVEPKDYFDVAVEQRAPKVSDEDVTNNLEGKRRELTEYKVIDATHRADMKTTDRDVLVLHAVGTIGDEKFDRDGMMVDLGEAAQDPIPGIGKALVGLAVDAKDQEISFSSKQGEGEKPAKLKVTVRDAREKTMPALDDEFAKDTGEAGTLAELREKTKQKLLAEDEKTAKSELRQALVKEILKKNAFPVAATLVERQLDALVHRAKIQMLMRGIDPRVAAASGALDEVRMRDDLRENANDEVRAAFLVDAIATKEKVEVNDAEFEKKIAEMAEQRQKPVPKLKAELQKEGRLETVRYQLREEKTLDLLLSRAKISDKA